MAASLGLAVLLMVSLRSSHSASAGGVTDLTALFIEAQPGTTLAGYRQGVYIEPGNGWTFSASVNDAKTINVSASSAQESWTISLGGPGRTLITPGIYEVARSNGAAGRALLSIGGPNTYCSAGSVGRVTVDQIEMSSPTVVSRLAASFEVHCLGSVAGRLGEIRYHSAGIDMAAVTLSAEQLTFTPDQVQSLIVTNRGTLPETIEASLGGPFPDAFEITSNDCGALQAGGTCTIAVHFASAGSYARPAELQITDQTLRGGRYTSLVGQPAP